MKFKAIQHIGEFQPGMIIPAGTFGPDRAQKLVEAQVIMPYDDAPAEGSEEHSSGGEHPQDGNTEASPSTADSNAEVQRLKAELGKSEQAKKALVEQAKKLSEELKQAKEALVPFQRRNEDQANLIMLLAPSDSEALKLLSAAQLTALAKHLGITKPPTKDAQLIEAIIAKRSDLASG